MRRRHTVSPRLYLLIYCRGANRNCSCQLIVGHCSSRHLLRRCSFPLRSLYRSRLCNYGRVRSLISSVYRLHPPRNLNKNPLRSYICGSKPNILPPTFPRPSWHASSLLRLPGRLHPLKYSLFHWFPSVTGSSNHNDVYYLRSFLRQTRSNSNRTYYDQRRMTSWLPTSIPHI